MVCEDLRGVDGILWLISFRCREFYANVREAQVVSFPGAEEGVELRDRKYELAGTEVIPRFDRGGRRGRRWVRPEPNARMEVEPPALLLESAPTELDRVPNVEEAIELVPVLPDATLGVVGRQGRTASGIG
jgi:hypothetical protein